MRPLCVVISTGELEPAFRHHQTTKWAHRGGTLCLLGAVLTIPLSAQLDSTSSMGKGENAPIPGEGSKDPERASEVEPGAGSKTDRNQTKKTSAEPSYRNLRYEEDWSILRDGSGHDLWSPLKFIPLNQTGSAYLSVGGEARARTEFWSDFGFGSASAPPQDSFALMRLRTHTDWHLGPRLRLFIEGKSALATGRELPGSSRTADVDSIDLQNVILDLNLGKASSGELTLRVGRQEMLFGKQRLISPANWANTRPRVFDGVRGTWSSGLLALDAFWTHRVEIKKYRFNQHDPDTDFFGLYLTAGLPAPGTTLDLYWLGLKRKSIQLAGTRAEERRYTMGVRLNGRIPLGSLDYDLETAYQTGRHGSRDIAAWMVASQFGNQFRGALAARVYLGFDYASGDRNRDDNEINTFDPLFRTNHAFLGQVDAIGRLNIIDLSQGASFRTGPKLGFKLETHFFWRASRQDALYSAGGAPLRDPQLSSARWTGSEVDLVTTYSIDRHTSAGFGLGHFFPAAFLKQSGTAKRTDFGYLVLQYTF